MRNILRQVTKAAFLTITIYKNVKYCDAFSSVTASARRNEDNIKNVKKTVSLITGANGYIGKEIIQTLLRKEVNDLLNKDNGEISLQHEIICLVRSSRIEDERQYWKSYMKVHCNDYDEKQTICLNVLPYNMLDQGESLTKVLDNVFSNNDSNIQETIKDTVVYHVASKFGPSENHTQTALDNVKGTETIVRVLSKYPVTIRPRLILTSSMAAVRGTGQKPLFHESYYTHKDWNTMSKLGLNWGNSYQWSKCQSEKRAWELAQLLHVDMTSLCPSFVFGPFSSTTKSQSYSIDLVSQWIKGESAVQSRLCVDVRDVAMAHVMAAFKPQYAIGKRYIVSSEARLPSKSVATVLKNVCKQNSGHILGNGESIFADEDFDGGAIPIGEKEVDATMRLKRDLDLVCRDVEDTMEDMGKSILCRMKAND